MTSRIHHLQVGLLLLLYGSVVTVGEGWHALLPAGCCSCCSSTPASTDCPPDCCYCAQRAKLATALDRTLPFESQVRKASCNTYGDCPVCALLAQVQGSHHGVDLPACWHAARSFRTVATSLIVPQSCHEPYSARGPPASHA